VPDASFSQTAEVQYGIMPDDLYGADFRTISGTELFRLIEGFVRVEQKLDDRPREGYLLDFKEDIGEKFLRSVTALANTFGGLIIVGVSEDQGRPDKLLGVATSGELKTRVTSMIASNLFPCPMFDVAECSLPNDVSKKLCALKVRESQEITLLTKKGEKNPMYVRIEDQSVPADASQMRALLTRKRQNENLASNLSGRITSLKSALFVTNQQGAQRFRSETFLQIVLCPHNHGTLPLDLGMESLFGGLVQKIHPGLQDLANLSQAKIEFQRGRDWFEIQFLCPVDDYERRWRLTATGDIGFITQVNWPIPAVGNFWSLYDFVADVARVAILSRDFWCQTGYFGGFRLEVDLVVGHLPFHGNGLAPLFYSRMGHIPDFSLDGRAIFLIKQPRESGNAQLDLGYDGLNESLSATVANIVNQVLRCLGHTCNIQGLQQAVQLFPM
jgi:hypothetical protein